VGEDKRGKGIKCRTNKETIQGPQENASQFSSVCLERTLTLIFSCAEIDVWYIISQIYGDE
jgi:hypothetical protein